MQGAVALGAQQPGLPSAGTPLPGVPSQIPGHPPTVPKTGVALSFFFVSAPCTSLRLFVSPLPLCPPLPFYLPVSPPLCVYLPLYLPCVFTYN